MARRKKKKRRLKFLRPRFFIWFFLVLFFLAIFIFIGQGIFHSSFFEIEGELDSDFFSDEFFSEELAGQSIFELDLDFIYRDIAEKYPEYRDIVLLKRFPNKLEVQAKKRIPVAQVSSHNFYLVDREGVIVSSPEGRRFDDFPVITGPFRSMSFAKGQSLYSQNFELAFQIIKFIEAENLLSRVNSLDQGYQFKLDSIDTSSAQAIYFYLSSQEPEPTRIKVIIDQSQIRERINLLAELMTQKLAERLSLIRYLDFRFQKVVIGFRK